MAVEKILLGYGVFSVDGTPIGLTRGGGSFVVESEFREIEADGDYGVVEGRVVIDRQDARLTVNALTAFSAEDMLKYYPALANATGTVTGTLKIAAGDYKEVSWAGKTLDGKTVTIKLDKALNMGNIDLSLEDKNEVVPELEFTATYLETARSTPAWNVVFGDE